MTPAVAEPALDGVTAEGALRLVYDLPETDPRSLGSVSFLFFCTYYLAPHFDAGFGEFQYPLMEELSDLQPGQHLLKLFPREHGKTTVYTFAFVLWCICYRKKRHIGIVSSVSDTSEKFLMNIKAELQNNPLLLRDFGDLSGELADTGVRKKLKWKTKYIKTTNYVIVFAASTNGNVRGVNEALPVDLKRDFIGYDRNGAPQYRNMRLCRPDLFICDDIVDDKFIITKRVRDKTWWWFWKQLYNATEARSANVIVVGTTLHDDDIVSRLYFDQQQTSQWKKDQLSAVNPDHPFDALGNPVDILFPEKWGQIDYNRPLEIHDPDTGETRIEYRSLIWWKHHDIGAAFGPEFLMRPMQEGQKYFDKSWFSWYCVKSARITPDVQRKVLMTTGKMLEYLPSDLLCVTTVDPAGTDEITAENALDPDYTVVATTGYSPSTRRFYVVAINRMRCTPGQMLQSMLIHYQMYNRDFGAKYVPDRQQPEDYYVGFPFQHIGIGIETVAFQKVLAGMLEELAVALGMYPMVIEVDRGDRRSKRMRAMQPSALAQQGLISFPSPLIPGNCGEDMLAAIDELHAFPQAGHDDCVDAIVDGVTILNALALTINRGLHGQAAIDELLSGAFGFQGHRAAGFYPEGEKPAIIPGRVRPATFARPGAPRWLGQ